MNRKKQQHNFYRQKISSQSNCVKPLENIKQGFKRRNIWNKYGSATTKKPKNNDLHYMIDPTFRNVNRMLVPSFKNDNDDPTRHLFDKYYMPLAEIKDFNALIGNKPFFDQPIKKQTRNI